MFWTFLILIVIIIFIAFFYQLSKDNNELEQVDLSEKFGVLVNILNSTAFSNNGYVTKLDKRTFNLYEAGSNQIIQFMYSTGNLEVNWRYKYFQKEIVHKKLFSNVRNISTLQQQNLAYSLIEEMKNVIEHHKENVLKDLR